MATYAQIQHPRPKGEKVFQDFCLKLLRLEWDDPGTQIYGRSGQKQFGVDILGNDIRGGRLVAGCQCKGSETNDPRKLTIKEIEAEVEAAKGFTPPLNLFIIAYAGHRDAKLQSRVAELNLSQRQQGLFKIVLWSWDDIADLAETYPQMREKMYILDGYIALVLDPKRPPSNPLGDSLSALHMVSQSVHNLIPSEQPSGRSVDIDAVAEAKIDLLRDQIRAGNSNSVIDPLTTLIAELPANAHPHLRFRAWANLGAALAQCRRWEEATRAYDEAATAEPDTADSQAYKAYALMLRGQTEDAYKEANAALSIDPYHRIAATILIESAPSTIEVAALERRFSTIATSNDVASSLVSRYSQIGAHVDALRVARAMDTSDSVVPRDATVAQAILTRLDSADVRMGLPMPGEDRALLAEALDLLERSWSWAKGRGDKALWYHLGANLVTAYRFTGDDETADDLALEIHDLAPDNPELMERAVVAHMHKGRTQAAVDIAGRLASGFPRGALLAADIAAWAGDWKSLEKFAQQAYQTATNDRDKAHAADRMILAAYRNSGAQEALTQADALRETISLSAAFEARVAEIARRSGDASVVDAARSRLDAFDATKLDPLGRFALANAYADQGEYARAADLLSGLHTLDRPSEPLCQRLLYLYRADLRSKARELYESVYGEALQSKEILRLGAAIYEKAGMLPAALNALEAAINLDKADLGSRLDWARLRLRNNEEKKITAWIRKADTTVIGDPLDLMEFAQLLDRYGRRPEALALGYKTLRRHWGAGERLHLAYVSLFVLHPRLESFLKPKAVAVDTVVFLQNDHGNRAHYRIEAGADPATDVLDPGNPFAVSLIGKTVKDSITVGEGIGQPSTWRILEIKHKYVDLLHNAMDAHETLFPGSVAMGQYHIDTDKPDAFNPLFERVRDRARAVDNAVQIYKDNVIPLDTIGTALGIDVIDASRGMRVRSGITIDACVGDEPERRSAQAQLSNVCRFLVDPMTLGIWQDIGLLAEAERIKGFKVCVVQATLDLLRHRLDNAKLDARQNGGVLEAHGEKIVMFEPTKGERDRFVAYCAELLDWCQAHATVIPTEPLENTEQAIRILSPSTIATLGTLVKTGMPAIIEDRRLRVLASSMGATKMGWTQALLNVWVAEGKVARPAYAGFLAKLHQANIGFVSVSAADLMTAVGEDEKIASLLATLRNPTVEPNSLVSVAVNFIIFLWGDAKFRDVRDRLASQMLEALLTRKDGDLLLARTIRGVARNLGNAAYPLNLIMSQWLRYAEGFATGHFIYQRIFKPRLDR